MILLVVILTLFLIWLVIRRWQRRKLLKLFQQFDPKRIALPFIGHAYWFLGKTGEERMDKFKMLGEMSYERGGLVSFWQGNQLYLLVSDPASAKTIMKTCLEKDDVYAIFRGLTGNGSVFALVSFWRSRRKAISPAFSQKSLNPFMGIFNQQSRVLVNHIKNFVGKSYVARNMMTNLTFDVVCESTMGIKTNSLLDPTNPFINALSEVGRVMCERTVQPWLQSEVVYRALPQSKQYYGHIKFMHDFVHKVIKPELDSREKGYINSLESVKAPKKEPDFKTFLQIFLETTRLDATELKEEMVTAVVAGSDTTAMTLTFTTCMLAAHPRVQEACYKELQEVFADSDRDVTVEDLPRLQYLELAIKETMRLYPSVPLVIRKVEKDLELPSGTTLVAGCGIYISIFAIHRNPKYWGHDADKYRPERFEETDFDHAAAYMPFSYGLRGCVGSVYAMMLLKTSLATLLRRYRILPSNAQTCNQDKPIRIKIDITTKDVEDIEVKFECRKNSQRK